MIIRNAGIANDEDTFSLYKLRDTAMTTTVDIRKIFKRDDIRGLYPEELNADTVFLAGRAMAERLAAVGKSNPRIVVGYDARLTSPELRLAFCHGVAAGGGEAEDLGLVSTEHVYYACGQHPERYAGGAMITASHNPAAYNGIKMVHAGAAPFSSADLNWLQQRMMELLAPATSRDLKDEFADYLVRLAGFDAWPDRDQPDFTIVAAAGHGVGGVAFQPIADRLAAKGLEVVWTDPEPDGRFPHGVPNPLLPDFMERLGRTVVANNADLGIGFDGDADRAGFTDNTGQAIAGSFVLALAAKAKLARHPRKQGQRPLIFRNLCCSQLLVDLYNNDDTEVMDTPVGHGKIKLLMRHDAYRDRIVVAGEHSGHFFYPEFHFVDSGMLTSLYLLMLAWEMKRRGVSLTKELTSWRQRYSWSGEVNFNLSSPEEVLPVLLRTWKENQALATARYEVRTDPALGLDRVFLGEGDYCPAELAAPDLKMVCDRAGSGWWFVLRPSGNEPKLRLNVEAWGDDAVNACRRETERLATALRQAGAKDA